MDFKLYKELEDVHEIFCDNMDDTPYGKKLKSINQNMRIRHKVDIDLVFFLLYLSASDGKVDDSEKEFITGYFPYFKLTIEDMKKIIKEQNIYSTWFQQRVPETIELFVDIDKLGITEESRNKAVASSFLYNLYFNFSKNFLEQKRNVTSNEVNDANIYLEMLRKYISSKLEI